MEGGREEWREGRREEWREGRREEWREGPVDEDLLLLQLDSCRTLHQ